MCKASYVFALFLAAQSFAAAEITVQYPAAQTLFPPDMAAPTILWHDSHPSASVWTIEITFADKAAPIRVVSKGGPRPLGEIDRRCAEAGAVPPELPPEERGAQSWRPDEPTWAVVVAHAVRKPARLRIYGHVAADSSKPVSRGETTIRFSRDPVGAPVFYRDVPLISVPVGEKGVIMPLPADAVPFIGWRMYDLKQRKSRLLMEGLPTCANCHSFSKDGKTLGIDVDGPQNDKGLYGIVPVATHTSIRNEYVIRWSAFAEERASKRFGFMSQVSPDGKHVVTSIEDPSTRVRGLDGRLYNGFYKDYGFGQVFFPTKGILAWYSSASKKLLPLPGADDPKYVHAGAFWSPDGKWLVFSRALAKEPYHEGQKNAEYANDPNETQIQYDLYRIPFNDGKGGTPERIAGASQNGMSNNFPKVSPDGKWIVYVQNRNGLLMRPDSQLYIVPFEGGKSRRLKSNTSRMNSWHSWSPNGRWLVFASKGRSLYTQMYLTHIDEKGADSPAVLIENATAANRAVNIPEFVNTSTGVETMDAPATDFYRLCDLASDLVRKGRHEEAAREWGKAVELDGEDARARYNLAVQLHRTGDLTGALAHYRKALELKPDNSLAHTNIGIVLVARGELDAAMAEFTEALRIDPQDASAEANLGAAHFEKGNTAEAIEHCRKAVAIDGSHADALNVLGVALAKSGRLEEAVPALERAIALNPEYLEYRYNIGRVLAAQRRFKEALPHFEKAVELSQGAELMSLDMLAAMYSEVGRAREAADTARKALDIALRSGNAQVIQVFRGRLSRYESLLQQTP